jgi:hypothetical protein
MRAKRSGPKSVEYEWSERTNPAKHWWIASPTGKSALHFALSRQPVEGVDLLDAIVEADGVVV